MGTSWKGNLLTVERVVRATIFEVLSEATAYDETVIGVHSHVAFVEEPVNVAAEEDSVRDFVNTLISIGTYVRRLQDWKGVLGRHGAGAPVGGHDF